MALADFDIYRRNVGSTVAITTTTPLVAPGSLRWARGTVPDANAWIDNLVPVSPGTHTPVGVVRGALACCVQIPTTFTQDNGNTHYTGILCVQSVRDLAATGSGKTAYALCLQANDTDGITTVAVTRFTNALANPIPAPLWSLTLPTPIAKGTLATFELEWDVNTLWGGVRFLVRQGTATNYSDLTLLHDFIHEISPLPTASAGEGPLLISDTGATSNFEVRLDQWRLRA